MTKTNEEVVDVVETAEKLVKRASVSLAAGGSKLLILAQRKADGSGAVTVTHTDSKKKSTRGMTRKFDSFAEACEVLKDVERDAVRKGWKKSARAGGFKAKPDAFTTMPVAPKAGAK